MYFFFPVNKQQQKIKQTLETGKNLKSIYFLKLRNFF